jgi:hypothetical protein
MDSKEEDDGDDDVKSWYDTVTTLVHLPNMRFLQEPIGGGSTSQASRVASAPIEGEVERTKRRGPEGPSERGSDEPVVLPSSLVALHTCGRSPRTSSVGKSTVPPPKTKTSSSGVRTRG